MAKRRMFAQTIIDSDSFLDMALSTQALYFHLSMRGDDEGFINNPKKIMRMIGASEDELKVLIAKRFILTFESGVIVIKHWKLHNSIRADRINETVYLEERDKLLTNENGSYSMLEEECNQMTTTCQPNDRIGKDRLVEVRLGKVSIDEVKDILGNLNLVCKTNFQHRSKKTQSLIQARLNEGFTLDDFKHVHMVKASQWLNDAKMVKFLRPETLYGSKFEGYLNEQLTDSAKVSMVKEHTGLSANEILRQAGVKQ